MSDDGIEINLRFHLPPPSPRYRIVIRHTSRTWFRLTRADRNRLRRGEEARSSAWPRYRRTRKMRDRLAARAPAP